MEQLTTSEHVHVQAGDCLIFQGTELTSKVIAWTTDWPRRKISHCAIIADEYNNLAEATTLDGENGVAIIGVQYKIDTYPGHIWHLPLLPQARKDLCTPCMMEFIWKEINHPYSKLQAVLSTLRVGQALHNWADDWYCSKLVATALIAGHVLPVTFDTSITPSALSKLGCFGEARQLK